jgi:hypothetical protein
MQSLTAMDRLAYLQEYPNAKYQREKIFLVYWGESWEKHRDRVTYSSVD